MTDACSTCTEGGKPGYIWQEQNLIPCWECNDASVMRYFKAHVGAPRPESPPDTAAVLYIVKPNGKYIVIDLNDFQANQLGLNLLKLVRITPPVNNS